MRNLQLVLALLLSFCLGFTSRIVAQAGRADELPVVESAEVPMYPLMARIARLEGTLTLRVQTDGTAITGVTGEGGSPLLRHAAEKNLRTWRFVTHKPTIFEVTFVYSIDSEMPVGGGNSTVVLKFPTRVEVRTGPPQIETARGEPISR